MQILLCHIFINILNKKVSFRVIINLWNWGDDSKSLSTENKIVHGFEASLCFFFWVELEVSITKWFACSSMESNFSALKSETLTGEQFEEIEIKEILLW